MTTKFEQDLKNGQEYEKKALLHIQQKYPKAYIIDGYCLDWDIYIPELRIGVEVKSDAQYKETGNFYVEYSCKMVSQVVLQLLKQKYIMYI
jgi:hypothetical protein